MGGPVKQLPMFGGNGNDAWNFPSNANTPYQNDNKPQMSSAVTQLNKYFNINGRPILSSNDSSRSGSFCSDVDSSSTNISTSMADLSCLQTILLAADPFAPMSTLTPFLLSPTALLPMTSLVPLDFPFSAASTMLEETKSRVILSKTVKISVSSKTTLSSRHFSGII